MIQIAHVQVAGAPQLACITCGEGTDWRGTFEPTPGLQISRPLCPQCTGAIVRVGVIVSRIAQVMRVLRSGKDPV
jgi:hypothetical protein